MRRSRRILPICAGCIRRAGCIPGLLSYYHPVRGIIKSRPSRTCIHIFRNVGPGTKAYRVAAEQKTIKPCYHPGRRLHHFNFPSQIDPSRRSFCFGPCTAGIRSPFNLDPTYGSPRPVDGPCRTSYLFYLL